MMREFIEELKIVFGLRHVLYLANVCFLAVVSFVNWDLLWWLDIGDWIVFDRIMFLIIIVAVNIMSVLAYNEWIKKDE